MRQLFYGILFILCCPSGLRAQPVQQFVFTHLGPRQGLASDEVMGIQQDKKGFIWIATLNGLQRFDGNRFLTFSHKKNNPRTIPSNKVFKLMMDKKDRLWVLCSENKVGYFNVADFTFREIPVRLDNDLLIRGEATLFQDNAGNIFLQLSRIAMLRFDEESGEFTDNKMSFTFPPGWKPVWIMQDNWQNNYWLACDSGLAKYNPRRKLLSYRGHNEEKDPVIDTYAELRYVAHQYMDNSGRFWLESWAAGGSGPYLYSYDMKLKIKKEWESTLNLTQGPYHEIHALLEQDNGTIWIAGLNLLSGLPKMATSFEFVQNNLPGEFSIRYDLVKQLYQDREKNIWVSTDKGLFRFNPTAQLFQIVPNKRANEEKIYTPDVTDILQTKKDELLVTTWGNGSFLYDKHLKPVSAGFIQEGLRAGEGLIWCSHQRLNGDIWRASQGGSIFITPAGSNITRRLNPPVFEEATIRQITEDRKGNLWFGTHRGHLVKWDAASNSFELIRQLSTIYRLFTDKEGTIWVCTGGNGVFRINPETGAIMANYNSSGVEGKKLMGLGAGDIIQYNDSTYIIASEGLNIVNIKTGDIRFYTTDNGLPTNSVNNILMDKRGYLWVTTESQLCRIQLEKSIIGVFNEEDGLPASSFNVASAQQLNDGRMAIGRAHDFIVFDPEKISPDYIPLPDMEITGFALMNEWLPMDSLRKLPGIDLRYNQNSVTIEFSTLTYLNSFAINYMMEGLDKTWINPGISNQAIYNYLPPGDYVFKIKAENGEGLQPSIATLKISVRNPFWRTWWFYSILVLLAAAVFFYDDRTRQRRKSALQKMRSDIAGNLHEEVNTALNNINMLSEIARIKADKEPEQSKAYINEIHAKSHNMIIAMDDMLWSIDPANDSMAKTIDRIKEFAAALRNRHEATINLQTDEKVESLNADMKFRHELLIIYKLALRILIEEMKSPQTSIQLDYVKSQLQLNIFSSHVRLADNNNQVIKMIEEMRTRAATIMASLEIHSDEKGVAIILAARV